MTAATPSTAERLRQDLKLPVIVAPMFLVSTPKLLLESCKAGLIGSLPTQNARITAPLRAWFDEIRDGLAALRAGGLKPGDSAATTAEVAAQMIAGCRAVAAECAARVRGCAQVTRSSARHVCTEPVPAEAGQGAG